MRDVVPLTNPAPPPVPVQPPVDVGALRRLFVRGLFLRLIVAVVIHISVPEEMFAPDQAGYHAIPEAIALHWSGEYVFIHPKATGPGPKAYFYIVAVQYFLLGALSIIPKLVNALVGAITIRVVHDLALRVSGSTSAAYYTAALCAYFPSLILWSALNIRDAWIILLIVLICRQALVLYEKFSPGSLFLLFFCVFAIVQFRDYILFPVTLPVVVSFFARNRAHLVRNVFVGMLAAAAVIYTDQAAGSGRQLRTLDFEAIHEMRYWNTVGAGSSFEQADISTPMKAIMFLPKGLAFFLLAPFPWMLGSVRQILAVPETLFFYSLIPHILRGFKYLLTHRLSSSLMIILLTAGMTFGYALGEGNAGTAYRHRAQMLPCYLLFAAVGRERRKAAQMQAPVIAWNRA